jgi:hypothetical protein
MWIAIFIIVPTLAVLIFIPILFDYMTGKVEEAEKEKQNE